MVCGLTAIHEQAYCYSTGSKCEQLHKEGKNLASAANFTKSKSNINDILDTNEKFEDITHGKFNGKSKFVQCGVKRGPNRKYPWALKIIGK